MTLDIEAFGNGAVFEPINGRESVTDWIVLAYLIGEANGCPRVTRNLQKQAAREYFEKHLAENYIWHELVDCMGRNNPKLLQSLVESKEMVPEDESYNSECVPKSYSVGRARKGLAMDSAYFVVKGLCDEKISFDQVAEVAQTTDNWFEFSSKLIV